MTDTTIRAPRPADAASAALPILGALSFCHLLNDMMQSLVPAIYPMLKDSYALSFGELGLVTLAFQFTASLLQPVVGIITDWRPQPYSLSIGMGATLVGLVFLSVAHGFWPLVMAASLIGLGSAVFHPESSRVARLASGGRHGFAQSLFQVGGNCGSAAGPLLAAYVVLPHGQASVSWFSAAALLAMVLLAVIGTWYRRHGAARSRSRGARAEPHNLSRGRVTLAVIILLVLIFSKYFYLAGLTNYYTFYLISKFHVSVQSAQIHLFIFLAAAAAGTFVGGPLGDRIGRKYVIWGSILGVLPFSLALPYVDLLWTGILTAVIGLILSSAFSAILVFAQELLPGKIGMISGLFFGFAFGMGGVGAAALGGLADLTSIDFVYKVTAFLPALGMLTVFLPNLEAGGSRRR